MVSKIITSSALLQNNEMSASLNTKLKTVFITMFRSWTMDLMLFGRIHIHIPICFWIQIQMWPQIQVIWCFDWNLRGLRWLFFYLSRGKKVTNFRPWGQIFCPKIFTSENIQWNFWIPGKIPVDLLFWSLKIGQTLCHRGQFETKLSRCLLDLASA